MRRNEDTFQKWKREGILNAKLDYLRGASSNFYSQKKMASDLGISEQTFITLKNKYKEIREAIAYGNELLKAEVMSAVKKRAVGFTSTQKVKSFEKDGAGRTKQKLEEIEKVFPPDIDAAKYILTVLFGREFSPKKEELDLMEKKLADSDWVPFDEIKK